METLKHSIKIYRGEQFTIDKNLVNKDGSPYIVPSNLQNPYFLLSISDKSHAQEGREVNNFWLPVQEVYELSKPVNSNTISNFYSLDFSGEDDSQIIYKNGDAFVIYPDTAVFFIDDESNEFYGKYVKWNKLLNDWSEYKLNISYTFGTNVTSDWKTGSYYYTIQLVTGELIREHLENLADSYGIFYNSNLPELKDFDSNSYTDNETLVNLIKASGHKFPVNFTYDQPLGFITASVDVLPPTDLEVINYMQGGVLQYQT